MIIYKIKNKKIVKSTSVIDIFKKNGIYHFTTNDNNIYSLFWINEYFSGNKAVYSLKRH